MSQTLLRALIIDDEPMARELLETHCKQTGQLLVMASCKNAVEAFQVLHQQVVDVMFLDVNMPGINGLNFLKSLKDPPKVIFTTAYHEHAVEAFELDAIDYLLKPITYARFLKAVQKLKGKVANNVQENVPDNTIAPTSVFLKVNRRLVQVELNNILYFESYGDYVKVFTTNGLILCFGTISKLLHILPANLFQRIHRSYMVSLKRITFMEANFVRINEQDIPIGPTYKEGLMKQLNLSDNE